MLLESRILRTEAELESYVAQYNAMSGTPVLMSEVRSARVRGFYSPQDPSTLLAGYAVSTTAPFRYLTILPKADADRIVARLGEENICACFAFWFDPEMSRTQRLRSYLICALDILRTRRRYILAGTGVPQVRETHMMGLPYLLFDGWADVHGHKARGWAYYGTPFTVLRGAVVFSLRHVLKRGFRRRPGYRPSS